MARKQKTLRANSEMTLDVEVNKLLLEGWERGSDARLAIKQTYSHYSSSDNEEIWYQTLTKYNEETK
jgi:hypothetical protein